MIWLDVCPPPKTARTPAATNKGARGVGGGQVSAAGTLSFQFRNGVFGTRRQMPLAFWNRGRGGAALVLCPLAPRSAATATAAAAAAAAALLGAFLSLALVIVPLALPAGLAPSVAPALPPFGGPGGTATATATAWRSLAATAQPSCTARRPGHTAGEQSAAAGPRTNGTKCSTPPCRCLLESSRQERAAPTSSEQHYTRVRPRP